MSGFKVGDVVKTNFGRTGKIQRLKTFRGTRVVCIDTGELYTREADESELTLITECASDGCKGTPDSPDRRGVWHCNACWGRA